MILEMMGNHSRSRQIGEATYQALEKEDKIKAATLEDVIDAKVSGSVRKFYSEDTLQMSKLAKKVIDLEKRPKDKAHVMEGVQHKRSRKKAKRQANRKEKRSKSEQGNSKKVFFQQQNHTHAHQEINKGRDNRGDPSPDR